MVTELPVACLVLAAARMLAGLCDVVENVPELCLAGRRGQRLRGGRGAHEHVVEHQLVAGEPGQAHADSRAWVDVLGAPTAVPSGVV